MSQYKERLEELRSQMAHKNRLERTIKELKAQRQELSNKVYELGEVKDKEQADVDKLEGRSLAAFYYHVIGKKDDMLAKEQQEAYAARVKYDAAVRELDAVEADIQNRERELRSAQRSEELYQQVLQEKAASIKASGSPDADEIIRLENHMSHLENQQKELSEAIFAGKSALNTVELILSKLDDADGFATWDMFGGGLLVDMAKHESLDTAQELVETLQVELRRFKTELADVQIQADMQIQIDGFMRFADYFFDGLFADWAVKEKISQSQQQVIKTKDQIKSVLHQLNRTLTSVEQEKKTTKAKLDYFVYAH